MVFVDFAKYLFVMAGTTYAIRLLPLIFLRRELKSRFLRSFLYYVPYAVLAAMTIPDVFSSTGNRITAIAGLAAAVAFSIAGKSLVFVALAACAAAFLSGLIF